MKRGFTLIEMLVYLGILALISVAAVRLVLSVSFNAAEVKAERTLTANGEAALETLVREIRLAYDLNAASSVFGTNPSTLVLNTYVSPTNQTLAVRTFSSASSRLARQDSGGPAEFITSSDVKVTEFTVWYASSANSILITFKIGLEAGEGRFKESKNFYGSAVLRAKY